MTNNIRNARALVLDLISQKNRDSMNVWYKSKNDAMNKARLEVGIPALQRQLTSLEMKAKRLAKTAVAKADREYTTEGARLNKLREAVLFASTKELKAIYDKETKR